MTEPVRIQSRARGAIWGTCVADALGGPVQFKPPGTFEPITDLRFVEPFQKPAGSYSDDGSMTLALAKSFVESKGRYNHARSIEHYIGWLTEGKFSTAQKAWDVGLSTRKSLSMWRQYGIDNIDSTQFEISAQLDHEGASGNGSLMRISPVGVALWTDPNRARNVAKEQSRITHPAIACLDACEAYTLLICGAMNGETKEELCKTISDFQFHHPDLVERLARYKTIDDWKTTSSDKITSSGWVVDTIEAALWGFFKYESWETGVLAVVNLGGDSDTAGAVYGSLAGIFYGYDSIPTRWVEGMQNKALIHSIAEPFAEMVPA
ncbi:hypothetical protein N7462_001252 [Penicillium macrosclerotiorum]|uniref:uncharacterized protein n=1 Tax=Penicillium macrosclerotiorum TaxID=303699 RepID=UPI002547A8D0|nr:uncharacterized protein N7462_001252 [Penicillium macrosclerotiorum]KAJ5691829.1 hypothetical protein N7462_001252 [Penicillium macrosclerotiorum]